MELKPDQYTNIMTTLATLVAGQAATNAHLTMLNGKVASHEKEITNLRLWKAGARGFSSAINVGWTTFVAVFTSAISGIVIYWLTKK